MLTAKRKIEVISCENGEWEVVRIDKGRDFVASGHSIGTHQWVHLLRYLGFDVEEIELTEEEMEKGDY